jgi:hypothetical protein
MIIQGEGWERERWVFELKAGELEGEETERGTGK